VEFGGEIPSHYDMVYEFEESIPELPFDLVDDDAASSVSEAQATGFLMSAEAMQGVANFQAMMTTVWRRMGPDTRMDADMQAATSVTIPEDVLVPLAFSSTAHRLDGTSSTQGTSTVSDPNWTG